MGPHAGEAQEDAHWFDLAHELLHGAPQGNPEFGSLFDSPDLPSSASALPNTDVEVPGASVAGEGVGGESEVALAVSAVLDRDGWSGAFARPEGALEPEVLADFWTRRLDDGP